MDIEIETEQAVIEPRRHIDQLMLQTRAHHVQLSSMADIKANIMLTLAALIVTFSIGYLDDPLLRWPVLVMIFFCFVTIVSAAYAVMPKLNGRDRSEAEISQSNILFFGNFMHMEYEAYMAKLEHVLRSPDRVYEAQIREIYELGVYLGRKKYRYIQIAYQSFLLGLVSSVVVYGIVVLFH